MSESHDMTLEQFEHACKRQGLKWWPEYADGHERPRYRVAGRTFGCCIHHETSRTMFRETLEMWLHVRDQFAAAVAA